MLNNSRKLRVSTYPPTIHIRYNHWRDLVQIGGSSAAASLSSISLSLAGVEALVPESPLSLAAPAALGVGEAVAG